MHLALLLAQQAPAANQPPGILEMLIPFVLMWVILYLVLIKPQQKKKDKEHQEMLKRLQTGDKVVSVGGIYGTVVRVKEQTVIVKIAENTKVEFSHKSIAGKQISKDDSSGSDAKQ